MDAFNLKNRFTYHPPKEGQPEKYEKIRGKALEFAREINELTPDGQEKILAMIKLDEVVFWANAAIARND